MKIDLEGADATVNQQVKGRVGSYGSTCSPYFTVLEQTQSPY